MLKIDDTIRQAVLRACEAMGGECALAAAVGCSQAQISRYRSGGCGYIRRDNWDKLYQHIAPYLPENFQPDTESPFPVGTTVRLNSGGPLMTVDGFENGTAFCAWFQGDEISRARFRIPALSVQSDKCKQSRGEEK